MTPLKSSPRTRPPIRTPSRTVLIILTTLTLLLSLISQITLPQPDFLRFLNHKEPSVLVLTAHPDDECMFFGPTVLALTGQGIMTSGLSLSRGNADGLGEIRQTELIRSYTVLGVPPHRVLSLDDPELQDGMTNPWSAHSIASALTKYPNISSITTIITFDEKGITNHPNHTPLSAGVQLWRETRSRSRSRSSSQDDEGLVFSSPLEEPQLIVLKTYPKRIKFLGPLYPLGQKASWLFSHLTSYFDPFHSATSSLMRTTKNPDDQLVITSTTTGYLKALYAMKEHESQLVWFRWLYVGASKYMWSNTLVTT